MERKASKRRGRYLAIWSGFNDKQNCRKFSNLVSDKLWDNEGGPGVFKLSQLFMLIPLEIISHVFSFLQSDPTTLAICSRAHHSFSPFAECFLYADVVVLDDKGNIRDKKDDRQIFLSISCLLTPLISQTISVKLKSASLRIMRQGLPPFCRCYCRWMAPL